MIPTNAKHDSHYSNQRIQGEVTFGPITLSYDTPADGDGETDILGLFVDDQKTDSETALCQGIENILEALDADWTALIHAKINP